MEKIEEDYHISEPKNERKSDEEQEEEEEER